MQASLQKKARAATNMAPDLKVRFLSGMSYVACTVNVVITAGAAGRGCVTVSAMSAMSVVSVDGVGPTLLVCMHHKSAAAVRIAANGPFCINVLRDDPSHVSDTFAGSLASKVADEFNCADWQDCAGGAPA
jgi:flavin reductase